MKRVSKNEYESALLIIKSYRDQKKKTTLHRAVVLSSKVGATRKSLALKDRYPDPVGREFDLSIVQSGDILIARRTNSKQISAGKSYTVNVGSSGVIRLTDDGGGFKYLSRDNKFRLWMVESRLV